MPAPIERPRDRVAVDDPNRRPADLPLTPEANDLILDVRRQAMLARKRDRKVGR